MNRREMICKLGKAAVPASLGTFPLVGKANDLLKNTPKVNTASIEVYNHIQIPKLPKLPDPNIEKVKYFAKTFDDDIHINPFQAKLVLSIHGKLKKTIRQLGFGNFNVTSLDEAITCNKRLGSKAQFTKIELNFIEELFSYDARYYGFFGEKVISNLTESLNRSKIEKIPASGHYLLKGEATTAFEKIKKEIGPSIYLTSGVRNVVKQTYLFLNKLVSVEGNLSKASRSLAPPGYSFHGKGDFDVGKKGLGAANFTSRFAQTDEYRKLIDLGHIQIRYAEENRLGVRYEPWHVKVI